MARGTRRDGFDVTRIVKVDVAKDVDNNVDTSKDNVINKLKGAVPEKERIFVYLDHNLSQKVKQYGKQVGRNAGGNSRIVAEALIEYFKKHKL